MFALALSVALIPLAIPILGHDEFSVRETASDRLRAWGPLALPYLYRASQSDDPEIRYRANALLRPWRCWRLEQAAIEVLESPWPVSDLNTLWNDEEMRIRLHRLAKERGAQDYYAKWIHPFSYTECGWFWGWQPLFRVHWGLWGCKKELGYAAGWPF